MNDKVTYEISESEISVNEDIVTSYGISCKRDNKIVLTVKDISIDRESVQKLADTCNELGLDPKQLQDVAEDFVII